MSNVTGLKEGRIRLEEFALGLDDATLGLIEQAGLDGDQFIKWGDDIAKGGEVGADAFQNVANAIMGVEDEALRNSLAASVMGTMYEDSGDAIFDALLGADDELINIGEATDDLAKKQKEIDESPLVKLKDASNDMMDALAPLLTKVAEMVTVFANWVSENPKIAAAITAISTVIGFLVTAFLSLAPVVGLVKKSFTIVRTALLALSGPIGLVIAAVTALIAAGIAIYKNWDTIGPMLKNTWETIKTSAVEIFTGFVEWFKNLFSDLGSFFSNVWTGIKDFFSEIATTIVEFGKTKFSEMKEFISAIIQGTKDTALLLWEMLRTGVTNTITALKDSLVSLWNSLKENVIKIINSLKESALKTWENLKTDISTIVTDTRDKVEGTFDKMKTKVSTIFESVKELMTGPIETAKETISNLVDDIKGFFDNLELRIPKPEIPDLPTIKLKTETKTILKKSITYPTGFDIIWNAAGGILDTATLIGAGEAGKEAIIPLSEQALKPFAKAIVASMPSYSSASDEITNNFNIDQIVIREEADIQKLASQIAKEQMRLQRAGGKVYYD